METKFLEKEHSLEVIREFAKLAVQEIERLNEKIAELTKSNVNQDQLLLGYQNQLSRLRSRFFGRGTEKMDTGLKPRKPGDLLVHGESLNPDSAHTEKKTAKDRKLPTENIQYGMTSEELAREAENRGLEDAKPSDWKELTGLFDEGTEISVVERTYKKVLHQRKKYIYKPSIGSEREIIVTAPGPDKLMPGAGYSLDFAIAVTVDKFQHHCPLTRQAEQMEMRGLVGVQAKTLFSLTDALDSHVKRAKIIEKIKQDIFNAPLAVNADETSWPIQDKDQSDGYLWAICNMAGAYYQFEPSRSGKVILELLRGYTGPVITDNYSGYNRLKNETKCKVAHCWAHARRNFYDLRGNHREDCVEIVTLIDELLNLERKGRSFEALRQIRELESAPLVERIKKWLEEKSRKYLLSDDDMSQAILYLLKSWTEFTLFLSDVRIPMTNNHAERSLRHGVLGRKNFNGSKTINGADVAADHYTVIETCKLVQLDPSTYYRYIVHQNNRGLESLSPLGYVRMLYERKLAEKEKAV